VKTVPDKCPFCESPIMVHGGNMLMSSNGGFATSDADVGTRFLTIHPDGSFDIDKDAPPLFVIGELAKAFIRQQDRIKRLEEAGDEMFKWSEREGQEFWMKAKEDKL